MSVHAVSLHTTQHQREARLFALRLKVALAAAVACPLVANCSSTTYPSDVWQPIAEGQVLASISDERLLETSVASDGTVFISGIRGSYRLLRDATEVEFLGDNPVPVVRISAASQRRLLLVGGSSPNVFIWTLDGWSTEKIVATDYADLFDVAHLADGTLGVAGAESTVAIKRSGGIKVDTVDVVPEHTTFWHLEIASDESLIALSSKAVVRNNADGVWERIVADQPGCDYLALVGNNDEFWVGGRPATCFFGFTDGKLSAFEELGLPESRFQMITDGEVQPDGSILMWGLSGLLLHVTRESLRALQFPDTDYFAGAAIVGNDLIFALNQRQMPDRALIVRLKLGQLRYNHSLAR